MSWGEMIHHSDGELQWYQFALLNAQPFVTHGVFGRSGGVSRAPFASLNAGPTTPDDADALAENYRRIRATLPHQPLLVGSAPQQGTAVHELNAEDVATHAAAPASPCVILPGQRDAFITRKRGVGVFWAVADCCVILLVNPVHRTIGLAHAGWRRTAAPSCATRSKRCVNATEPSRPTSWSASRRQSAPAATRWMSQCVTHSRTIPWRRERHGSPPSRRTGTTA